ncbi:MAG: hypothetical protein H7Y37_06580 [Anaerolineae bacterium]|nr:hypothetical protein [Gloeobacterales cyanobacterium ES-bin-313]
MPIKNFVADAIELVMKAWEGDRQSFERLSIASCHLGSKLLESELLELKTHSQLLENFAWGLKELDAEHHEGTVSHNYVALALATAMRACEGDQQSYDRLSQAAERFGYKLSRHNLHELKTHSQHLENIAFGLKEMEAVHL